MISELDFGSEKSQVIHSNVAVKSLMKFEVAKFIRRILELNSGEIGISA